MVYFPNFEGMKLSNKNILSFDLFNVVVSARNVIQHQICCS